MARSAQNWLVAASILLTFPTAVAARTQNATDPTAAQAKEVADAERIKQLYDSHVTDAGVVDPNLLENFMRSGSQTRIPKETEHAQRAFSHEWATPEQAALPLSNAALEVARDMGILDELTQLHTLKHRYLIVPKQETYNELLMMRMNLLEQMLASFLETRDVVATCDSEMAKYDSVAEYMEGKRDLAIRNNNILNFTSGGGLNIIGSAFQIGTKAKYQNVGNEAEVAQGALQMLISTYALKQAKGGRQSARRNPNMLGPILGRIDVDYEKYPPGVWAYLNGRPKNSPDTRRQILIKHWIQIGRIMPLDKAGSGDQLDMLSGTKELQSAVTIDLLRNRVPMIADIRAVASTISQSLYEIMKFMQLR